MLLQENFAEEHIRELQRTSRRDPVLLERAVYAFGLLEALAKVGMPFIFKGGTCLMPVSYTHLGFRNSAVFWKESWQEGKHLLLFLLVRL